jgi:hypothetical protein
MFCFYEDSLVRRIDDRFNALSPPAYIKWGWYRPVRLSVDLARPNLQGFAPNFVSSFSPFFSADRECSHSSVYSLMTIPTTCWGHLSQSAIQFILFIPSSQVWRSIR